MFFLFLYKLIVLLFQERCCYVCTTHDVASLHYVISYLPYHTPAFKNNVVTYKQNTTTHTRWIAFLCYITHMQYTSTAIQLCAYHVFRLYLSYMTRTLVHITTNLNSKTEL